MKFDVNTNTMAAVISIENEVYGVQQKVKKQQLTLMDMWKKYTRSQYVYIPMRYAMQLH